MDAVATAKLALDASGMDRGLQSASASLNKFANQAGSALAGAFAFDKLISGFSAAIEKGDQLQDIAEKFGVSASKLQLLGNAATVFGSNLEQVSAGLNKLSLAQQKAISGESGSEALVATFAEVGISMAELKTMSAEDIFLRISDSFASGVNDGRQFIIVNELLGKAQTDLIKVMNQGSAAIIAQGESMGVLSDEQISSLSEMSDAVKTLQVTMQNSFGKVALLIVPVIKETQVLLDLFGQFRQVGIELGKGNFSGAKEIVGGMSRSESKARLEPQKVSPASKVLNTGDAEAKAAAKDFADSEKQAAVQELKLIEAKIKGEQDAQKMAEKFEKEVADEKIKLAKENADIQAQYEEDLFKAEQEAARFEQAEKARMMKVPRETQQAKAGAAGQVLDFASGLGNRTISDTVTRERAKAAKEQQKVNKEEFDAKVRASTAATIKGSPRDMANRRAEFIKSEAGKEAKGQKTLADVYTVLDEALQKLLSAPIVGSGA